MTHKADRSFFDRKRPWSERKDRILRYYLTAYLPKIATQRKRILIVDGFAGPGRFGDGQPGSPTIIETVIDAAKARRLSAPVKCLFIESDDVLFQDLKGRFSMTGYVDCINSQFSQAIPKIESLATEASTFLYLDPYTVEGLEWEALGRIFRFLKARRSVELLLNFNAPSFVRRGLAALSLSGSAMPESTADDWVDATPPEVARLNQVVGGDWWQATLSASPSYPEAVSELTEGFCRRLRRIFREVCSHDIREKWGDPVPKYTVIFGSRHSDALLLMNEAMGSAREELAESSVKAQPLLIETRPTALVPDESELIERIVALAARPLARSELVLATVRAHFGSYREARIKRAIATLVESGRLSCAGDLGDGAIISRP